MKNLKYNYVTTILFSLLIFSCSVPDLDNNLGDEVTDNTISLVIPEGFDFRTHNNVKVTINDNSNYVKYDIYIYSNESVFIGNETYENEFGEIVTEPVYRNEIIDKLIFTGVPNNGVLSQTITVPTYAEKIYIRRNEKLKYSSSIENIVNKPVSYTHLTLPTIYSV